MIKKFIILLLLTATSVSFAEDVLNILKQIPDLKVQETTTQEDRQNNLQRFTIQITQPVDHFDPSTGTFSQKIILFHRDFSEPMLLQTSGYSIFGEYLHGLANFYGTNQLQVEHRYFAKSIPSSSDWNKLTVRQSAEDFHHIVEVFKQLYKAKWVNTGASKGGMTSIFHRKFYPNDVDGTVAYVAPLSFSLKDSRYRHFLNNVGDVEYAQCRQSIKNFQRLLLEKRKQILPLLADGNFSILKSKDIAYEGSVTSFPFSFWQYGEPDSKEGCNNIPTNSSSLTEMAEFFSLYSAIENSFDEQIIPFQPYYYQAVAELGIPEEDITHLTDLIRFPDIPIMDYLPAGASPTYTDETMKDIQKWVKAEARNIMFIYGEFDPWSAGAYKDINQNADNHIYYVKKGNHGAGMSGLSLELKNEAEGIVGRWFEKEPSVNKSQATSKVKNLEDVEFEYLRKNRL
jgi:hypothetical protein